jgi:hypothetical protein
MAYQEAVALIPGFLGFEQIGGFYYFADRVEAALRSALKVRQAKKQIPVVPVPTLPTERLKNRQKALLLSLRRIDEALGGVDYLHLLGHSTGGVDAYLLTGETPLDKRSSWEKIDPTGVRKKIKTVVSIGSPHHGTCITKGSLVRFFQSPIQNFWDFNKFAEALLLLAVSVKFDRMAWDAIRGALADAGTAGKYVYDVVSSRELTRDLRPEHLAKVHQQYRPGLTGVRLRSIVTMAGAQTHSYVDAKGQEGPRGPDAFFRYVYDETAGQNGRCSLETHFPGLNQSLQLLQKAIHDGDRVIQNHHTDLRPITPQLNDGIVNAATQLINPFDEKELWAVVIGDHLDVLGHYPRWITPEGKSPLASRVPLQVGVLHSGSGFGDDQFFDLYDRVAEGIEWIKEPARL